MRGEYTLSDAHAAGWEGEQAYDFVRFINETNTIFRRATGFDVLDLLGDWPSADYFSSGYEPEDAAEECIRMVNDEAGEEIFTL